MSMQQTQPKTTTQRVLEWFEATAPDGGSADYRQCARDLNMNEKTVWGAVARLKMRGQFRWISVRRSGQTATRRSASGDRVEANGAVHMVSTPPGPLTMQGVLVRAGRVAEVLDGLSPLDARRVLKAVEGVLS